MHLKFEGKGQLYIFTEGGPALGERYLGFGVLSRLFRKLLFLTLTPSWWGGRDVC